MTAGGIVCKVRRRKGCVSWQVGGWRRCMRGWEPSSDAWEPRSDENCVVGSFWAVFHRRWSYAECEFSDDHRGRGSSSVTTVPARRPLSVEEGMGRVGFNSLPTSPPTMPSVNCGGLAEKAISSPEKEPIRLQEVSLGSDDMMANSSDGSERHCDEAPPIRI